MPKILKQRDPAGNADTVVPDVVPEVFVDGVAGAQLGPVNTRLTFYVVTEPSAGSSGIEGRRVNQSIVIPTAALFHFMQNFQGAFNANSPALGEAVKGLAAIFSSAAEQSKEAK
ncbi:hypothetical protein [Burkholderia vietnamiensis]|uniref:hypothetical protein n=1 Tax=Burkholderia vietnamiensis TaxID=60552 RepID=UPI00158BBD29|nr:hypothetical protein [Burkholderia vietnamiensis]MCA8145497.1 hypothetical protein [Burkholderia vietnamiensis]